MTLLGFSAFYVPFVSFMDGGGVTLPLAHMIAVGVAHPRSCDYLLTQTEAPYWICWRLFFKWGKTPLTGLAAGTVIKDPTAWLQSRRLSYVFQPEAASLGEANVIGWGNKKCKWRLDLGYDCSSFTLGHILVANFASMILNFTGDSVINPWIAFDLYPATVAPAPIEQ